jgi:hypothetical protein
MARSQQLLQAELDLYNITQGDGGLGEGVSQNPNLALVSYTNSTPGRFPQDRVNFLVNETAINVVVTGADPKFKLPNSTLTLCEVVGGTSPILNGTILIFYDATQCNGEAGQGYTAFDANGNIIAAPNTIILFHEFAHAYHRIIGDEPPLLDDREAQATTDENELRRDLGLPLRSPTNHNGGGCTDCGAGANTPPPCFMISAAYGSPIAAEVLEFQAIREGWLGRSKLGYDLFDRLFVEYVKFALPAAKAMEDSSSLRGGVKTFLVEPLLNFYRMTDLFVRSASVGEALSRSLHSMVAEHASALRRRGLDDDDVASVATFFADLERALAVDPDGALPSSLASVRVASVGVAGLLAPSLSYIARLMAQHQFPRHLIWAVATPLAAYWQLLREHTSGEQAIKPSLEAWLESTLGAWMSRMPLSNRFAHLRADEARRELKELSRSFLAKKAMRAPLGRLLAERFAGKVDYDLRALLREMDFE